MILSGAEIKKQVLSGRIVINPFRASCVNPNSYNYHLAATIYRLTSPELDPKTIPAYEVIELTDKGYVLEPGVLYLASTEEVIGSNNFVTSLIGRSSVGRLGLFVQVTADMGNLGAIHNWTLELTVVQPLRLYPGMKIGQVSFWESKGEPAMLYSGKYGTHQTPFYSKMHEEFDTSKLKNGASLQ